MLYDPTHVCHRDVHAFIFRGRSSVTYTLIKGKLPPSRPWCWTWHLQLQVCHPSLCMPYMAYICRIPRYIVQVARRPVEFSPSKNLKQPPLPALTWWTLSHRMYIHHLRKISSSLTLADELRSNEHVRAHGMYSALSPETEVAKGSCFNTGADERTGARHDSRKNDHLFPRLMRQIQSMG